MQTITLELFTGNNFFAAATEGLASFAAEVFFTDFERLVFDPAKFFLGVDYVALELAAFSEAAFAAARATFLAAALCGHFMLSARFPVRLLCVLILVGEVSCNLLKTAVAHLNAERCLEVTHGPHLRRFWLKSCDELPIFQCGSAVWFRFLEVNGTFRHLAESGKLG